MHQLRSCVNTLYHIQVTHLMAVWLSGVILLCS